MPQVDVYQTYENENDAESFRKQYLERYPHLGYDTSLRIARHGDKWVVSGYRWSTCD